jgi:hypothetical protein
LFVPLLLTIALPNRTVESLDPHRDSERQCLAVAASVAKASDMPIVRVFTASTYRDASDVLSNDQGDLLLLFYGSSHLQAS